MSETEDRDPLLVGLDLVGEGIDALKRDRDEALRKLRVMCDAHSDLSSRGLLDDKLLSECERTFRTLPLNYQPDALLAKLKARAALKQDSP